jgi:nicotinamide mononucleotide (NMN) deamidase PncC
MVMAYNMRKSAAASVAARKASGPAGSRDNAPVELVCMALALALFVLAFRIATIW